MSKELILLEPRGFCKGVIRAKKLVEKALATAESPVYMRKQLVHNPQVVEALRLRGIKFVEDLADVPIGASVILSAHGVAPIVYAEAKNRELKVFDATCPIVAGVHKEVARRVRSGYTIIFVGHEGHDEVVGIMGAGGDAIRLVYSRDDVLTVDVFDPQRVVYFTQTTLTLKETKLIISFLQDRFPKIIGPDTGNICYATEERQNVVQQAAARVDLIIVIGGKNSSNCHRLREVAEERGVEAHLVESASDMKREWWNTKNVVALTAGASTPEQSVQEAVSYLRSQGFSKPWIMRSAIVGEVTGESSMHSSKQYRACQ